MADVLEAVRRPAESVPTIESIPSANELVGRIERAVENELSGQTLRELIEETSAADGRY